MDNGSREFLLIHSSTAIRLSPSSKPDITKLMSEMEEADVPISYTNELEEIYFTKIPGGNHGDYCSDRIRLAADKKTREILGKVLVHELAHHVDDQEDICSDDRLMKEKKKKAKYMSDTYAKRNVGEYFAVGFEVYYFGTDKEKRQMKKKNPYLHRTIEAIHKKYSRM